MILQEVSPHEGGKKMCITWSVDFFWCNELPGPEVPILSGGLLAISRKWWHESGGRTSELSGIGARLPTIPELVGRQTSSVQTWDDNQRERRPSEETAHLGLQSFRREHA